MRLRGAAVRDLLRRRVYPAFCEGLAVVGRPLLLARAKDMTSQTETRSCLVLAPHPDDETIGCGATIMRKLASGLPVHVVIATDGRHSHHSNKISAEELAEIRQHEVCRACAILGLPRADLTLLRFEDGRLGEHRPALRDRLNDILDAVNPAEVLGPSVLDAHPDHRILAELGRELVRGRRADQPALYEYPVWFWDPRAWRVRDLLELRTRTVRTESFLGRKREALAAHRSQLTNLTGEANWATLPERFLRQFLQPEEVFFEVVARE